LLKNVCKIQISIALSIRQKAGRNLNGLGFRHFET
jgi:hypothetical protein